MTGNSGRTPELLYTRILGGKHEVCQLWFRAAVLDKYRGQAGYKLIRTNTVGRLRAASWTLDFGIAGEDGGQEALIHVALGDAQARIPDGERSHWAAHGALLPASTNYLVMQLTRGMCVDDGDLRDW